MDNAANTTVADYSGHSRNATSAANTSSKTTTGPNSYLTAALTFNGSSDYASFSRNIADDFTILARFKTSQSGSGGAAWYYGDAVVDGEQPWFTNDFGTSILDNKATLGIGNPSGASSEVTISSSTSVVDNTWRHFAATRAKTSGAMEVFLDAASEATGTAINTNSLTAPSSLNIGRSPTGYGPSYFNGTMCDVATFSRVLTSTEILQAKLGPEPVNTVAPSLSGTQTQGHVVTCSSGTWGLGSPFSGGSNGTITYSYQWTRSNDGSGSGEANISGATSSTYTLQAGDVGKYIRCWVRASNDGGYDVAADTASGFTGAIAGAGGGANRLLNLRRRAAAA